MAVLKFSQIALAGVNTAPTDTIMGVNAAGQDVRWTPAELAAAITPTGPAGGDLAGTYPNPALAATINTAVSFTALTDTVISSGHTLNVGGAVLAFDNLTLHDNASFLWFNTNRSAIDSPADGTIRFSDSASLGLFTFGFINNTLMLGGNDVASPVAQALLAQSVLDGTSNHAGARFEIGGSKSTGNALGGAIAFQLSLPGSSGTTQNVLTDIFIIAPTGVPANPAAIIPGADDLYTLGGSGNRWARGFFSNSVSAEAYFANLNGVAGTPTAFFHGKGNSVVDLLLENTAASGKKWQLYSYLTGQMVLGNVTTDDWWSWNLARQVGRSDGVLGFANSTDPIAGTVDTGLGRNAAGVIEINNGTLGTLRDLKLRNLQMTSDTTGTGSVLGFGSNSPATTLTGPYTWLKFISSDNSTVYVAGYK